MANPHGKGVTGTEQQTHHSQAPTTAAPAQQGGQPPQGPQYRTLAAPPANLPFRPALRLSPSRHPPNQQRLREAREAQGMIAQAAQAAQRAGNPGYTPAPPYQQPTGNPYDTWQQPNPAFGGGPTHHGPYPPAPGWGPAAPVLHPWQLPPHPLHPSDVRNFPSPPRPPVQPAPFGHLGYGEPIQQQQQPEPRYATEPMAPVRDGSGPEGFASAGMQHNIQRSRPSVPERGRDAAEANIDQRAQDNEEYCGIHSKYGTACFCKKLFPRDR